MTSSIETLRQEIGLLLRRAREERGVTLRDLSNRTRIGIRHLEALEGGDFSTLEGHVFVRGFIVAACKELGKDPADLLQLLRQVEPSEEGPAVPLQTGTPAGGVTGAAPSGVSRWLLAFYGAALLGLLALALVALGVLGGGGKEPAAPPPAAVRPSAEAPAPAVAPAAGSPALPLSLTGSPLAPALTPPKAAPAVSPSRPAAPRPAAAATVPAPRRAAARPAESAVPELRLRITGMEKTWLQVQSDSDSPWEATLRPGDTVDFVAQDHFSLRIGNAGGVRFTLNGREIGPPGAPGQMISNFILNRDNL